MSLQICTSHLLAYSSTFSPSGSPWRSSVYVMNTTCPISTENHPSMDLSAGTAPVKNPGLRLANHLHVARGRGEYWASCSRRVAGLKDGTLACSGSTVVSRSKYTTTPEKLFRDLGGGLWNDCAQGNGTHGRYSTRGVDNCHRLFAQYCAKWT